MKSNLKQFKFPPPPSRARQNSSEGSKEYDIISTMLGTSVRRGGVVGCVSVVLHHSLHATHSPKYGGKGEEGRGNNGGNSLSTNSYMEI